MRADRLIEMMILLQNNGKMTTKELADQLSVSDRTILRDMDALTLAGIPVVSERGKYGGWRLMDHFRSSISGLNLNDLKALLILPSEKMLNELGIETSGTNVRQKLMASIPQEKKHSALQYLEKIHLDTGTWKPGKEKHAALQTVLLALWEDRKLEIQYEKASGDRSRRIVLPLGLVSKGSSWYLVAMNEQEEYRNFKITRIRDVNILHESFVRPKNFQLGKIWHESKLQFAQSLPRLEIKASVHESIMRRLTFTSKFVEVVAQEPTDEEGFARVTLHFNSEEEAIQYLLGFGSKVKRIEPAHVTEKIVERAKAVVDMYS